MNDKSGNYYYLGSDGKEYFTADDAQKYGGGLKGRRWHTPHKVYEAVKYDDIVAKETTGQMVPEVKEVKAAVVAANSLSLTEFDHLSEEQMKEILRQKGVPPRGNPKRETLLKMLKALSSSALQE